MEKRPCIRAPLPSRIRGAATAAFNEYDVSKIIISSHLVYHALWPTRLWVSFVESNVTVIRQMMDAVDRQLFPLP